MARILEPERSLEVVLETDVLVVGSGPGGLAAALSAARAGARTALVDRNGCFGGNITQVGVEGFAWYRHSGTVDCEGIGIEFESRAKAMGAAMPEPQSLSHALDAEMFKWVADVLVPYRALVPRNVGNLLVAGRCIGGDSVSHASARNMMCCTVSGQGAGVAAAVSLRRDEPFDRLDVAAVQEELSRQGVRYR
jgi:succinate dehydrogenase/fumarate reductase flavoprotein subunit